jgi:hypothetical protein
MSSNYSSVEISILAKQGFVEYNNNNRNEAKNILIKVYREIKSNPKHLKNISDLEMLGKCFLVLLDLQISDDIDVLQTIVSIGYFCTSKTIERNKQIIYPYQDRLLLLQIGHNAFKYTVMSALNLNEGGFMSLGIANSDLRARDIIYAMEIADLELNPILYQQVEIFKNRRDFFNQKIENNFFGSVNSKEEIIKSGTEHHNKILNYLENKIITNESLDF